MDIVYYMAMNPTSWTLYKDNPSAWDAMIAACEEAKESIDLENFIFNKDEIGERFIEACAKKAAEGVKVRFIWDAAGSFTFFGSSIIGDLKEKGIELIFFKTLIPKLFSFYNYRSWYFRNHRRTLVIDGKIGFTGSTCIYKRAEPWRDTAVKLEGPVVQDMQRSFERMWLRAHGRRRRRKLILEKGREYLRNMRKNAGRNASEFQYVSNSPFIRQRRLYKNILEAIRNANASIAITTPYFVPTRRLARVLRLAAHRGVEVKIILPESSDFPTVDLGARTFFASMLRGGVRIFLYKKKLIHTKSIVIDNEWATVGTLNLDTISLLYNFEANLVTTNIHFVKSLTGHFEEDLANTHEITLAEWNRRFFVEKIATFLVKFVRSFL